MKLVVAGKKVERGYTEFVGHTGVINGEEHFGHAVEKGHTVEKEHTGERNREEHGAPQAK